MMAFESLNDLVNMCYTAPIGDVRCHGAYVWSAYGIGLVVLVANLVTPLWRARQLKTSLRRRYRREQLSHESET